MHTVGRHWPKNRPKRDFVCMCDYCGSHFPRSKLIRDGAGLLACPKDAKGRDSVTLGMLEANNAARPNFQPTDQGGSYETIPDDPPPPVRRPP